MKIKLICFDLDGVLVDSREMHYKALNMALETIDPKYVIKREEHLSTYDGLSTTKKLNLLTKNKGLPADRTAEIWALKQKFTESIIDTYTVDSAKQDMLRKFKEDGYLIAVCSNSIRSTLRKVLLRKGFMEYVDYIYSNEDVRKTKPHSEIYTKAIFEAGVNAKETVIVEDSHIGREAAYASGAYLIAVSDPSNVTYDSLKTPINIFDSTLNAIKWQGKNMNVLIPMAGRGSRFEKAGYTFPKPLIEVKGKPMIQLVVENINIDAHYIFIVLKEHYEKYNLKPLLNLIAPGCDIVQVDGITEGAACTALLAKEYINSDNALLVVNSDQYVDWNSNTFMYSMIGDTIDGGILTFKSIHPKWSFAKLGDDGFVSEVAEKNPISDNATVGIYYWKHGSDFVKYAEQMIQKNIRVNNEFYICPVFNEAIQDGKKIKIFPIERMWGLGTPEDLRTYLEEHK